MKRSHLLFLTAFLFCCSCVPQNRLVEAFDPHKKVENIKLFQHLKAKSVGPETGLNNRQNYSISAIYHYEGNAGGKSNVSLELKMRTPVSPLDSVMFLDLDGEKFRMAANNSKNKPFIIPESLWVSIANAGTIKLRIYLGKEGTDIQLNEAQAHRVNLFFQRSMDKSDAKIPPLPEGYKKW